ncbi:MAG: hypothetical protein RID09_13270 [Coleofasciculus sp. G1-WW12-02]
MISCIYVNPETGHYWVIDYRIYAPDEDGKSKLDHVADMLNNAVGKKKNSRDNSPILEKRESRLNPILKGTGNS